MTGLGEVCSHIAALLFAVETYNRLNIIIKDRHVYIYKLCAWLPPTMQNVKYALIAEIDYIELASSVQMSLAQPSAEELSCSYEALSKTGKPAFNLLKV